MNEQSASTSFADTRREQIVTLLEREGEQNVDALAERFDVSSMTIRRDLDGLASEGKVLRTHGGARPAARISFEFRFLERAGAQADQKQAIAEKAASLVEPGQVVMLDSGTTTLAIARQLKTISKLTVITTSLPIASELFGLDHIDLILLGGILRKDAPDLIGPITDQNLDMLRADVAFIGADAVDLDGALYNASAELGRVLGRMAEASAKAYAVADSSKIEQQDLMRFARVQDWAGLITDAKLNAKHQGTLKKVGVHIIKANGSEKGRSQ